MDYLKTLLDKVKKDERILAVYLFGSHATGTSKPKSDIDIYLVLREGITEYGRIKLEYLQDLPSNYDVQIFQQLHCL